MAARMAVKEEFVREFDVATARIHANPRSRR